MRDLKVRDIMNRDVLVARESMTASELAAFLTENEISGAPVLDAEDRVVGVVSVTDLARAVSESAFVRPDHSDPDYYLRGWEELYNPEDLKGLRVDHTETTVADLMADTVHQVAEDAPVSECARLMLDGHLHRMLVLDGEKLVGIVTTFDLVRLVAEPS